MASEVQDFTALDNPYEWMEGFLSYHLHKDRGRSWPDEVNLAYLNPYRQLCDQYLMFAEGWKLAETLDRRDNATTT